VVATFRTSRARENSLEKPFSLAFLFKVRFKTKFPIKELIKDKIVINFSRIYFVGILMILAF